MKSSSEIDEDEAGALAARRDLMQACAEATDAELERAITLVAAGVEVVELRRPETGLVMLRGRIGGDGAAFNVGEATVTRAVVRLPTGEVGYSYLLGRSHDRARQAAMLDALAQTPHHRATIAEAFIAPTRARVAAERLERQRETDATRVDFFTLVRGED